MLTIQQKLFVWPMLLFSLSFGAVTFAETTQSLEDVIHEQDRRLFEIGFNQCNFSVFNQIFAKEFEFYDDRNGFNNDRSREIRSFKERCANASDLKRKLIASRVSKLGGDHAMQQGEHHFLINGSVIETAKFIHIWRLLDDQWVVSRVISYDHAPVTTTYEEN